MRTTLLSIGWVTALLALCITVTGCRTFGGGVTWAPERLAYHTNGTGAIDRVEEFDGNDVCRRILFYRKDGGLKLAQERDSAGVCRRSTYYDSSGRVTRVLEHDVKGVSHTATRFSNAGMPITPE